MPGALGGRSNRHGRQRHRAVTVFLSVRPTHLDIQGLCPIGRLSTLLLCRVCGLQVDLKRWITSLVIVGLRSYIEEL